MEPLADFLQLQILTPKSLLALQVIRELLDLDLIGMPVQSIFL